MQLSKENLRNIPSGSTVVVPDEKIFSLPEKVLQFGTGVLLRALPDYFFDKANRAGIFHGRVVVVKSTPLGGTEEFDEQDNLYTVCVRGIENNEKLEEFIINSSISRVISAKGAWSSILQCAHNRELGIVISNTTEVGITLTNDDIHLSPPRSFPGKLLSFLFERYKAFNGSDESGLIIIPTELIVDNGTKLRSIVLELAVMNKLEDNFIQWVKTANHFCNSLVDRIVPGKLSQNDQAETEKQLGYEDKLMIMAESFRLWAIESNSKKVIETLSFARADEGVVIAPDIEIFRELKLRLLNGTHSFSCGLAFLAGFKMVREAMNNSQFSSFIQNVALNEIARAMSDSRISYADACNFARRVLDRFRNPFIDHYWINIAVQYSAKMKQRNVPLLIKHYSKFSQTPAHMALGFAGFLLFMKCDINESGNYVGKIDGLEYPVQDDHAGYFAEKWSSNNIDDLVDETFRDEEFWGTDLSLLNGFAEAVKKDLRLLTRDGSVNAIQQLELNKTIV